MSNKKKTKSEEEIENTIDTSTEEMDETTASTEENDQNEGEEDVLQQQYNELKDKYIRLMAEFDNYKKRTVRERIDLMNTAAKDTMTALLPVLDDFDRAKKTADDDNSTEAFSEGVSLVYNKLFSIVGQKGLKAMETDGEPFDAELHDALTEIPAPNDDMKGKIIDTIEKGYFLNDKIIRHAKVVVGK